MASYSAVFDPGDLNPWRDHDPAVPLVLLPVRVETRWFATADAQQLELRVRVYPDAVHVANAAPPAGTPPVARGLPTRFALVLCRGADVIASRWGAPVPDEVAVLDHIDFATAEASGLAMRLTVARSVATQLTHLVVCGLRAGDADADQGVLQALLRDHASDRGVALLADGTWTGPGGPPRAPAATDAPLEAASDGARVALALGVPRETLQPVAGASRDTDAVPRAMAEASWPATWGYWLESVIGAPLTAAMRTAGRALFVEHVRAMGPLPTLAIGRQPYGLLPTTALARWRRADGTVDPLAQALRALLPRWVQAGHAAPQLPATGDALPALQAILARHEGSVRYRLRSAMAFDVAAAVWYGEDLDDARRRALQAVLARPIVDQLTALGVPVPDPTVIAPLIHDEAAREIMLPLVGSSVDGHAPPYLASLAALTDPWLVRGGQIDGATPRTLLYTLLRHATLLVLGRTADMLAGLATVDWREADVAPLKASTLWGRMERPLAAHGGQTARALLQADVALDGTDELRAHRAALRVLAAGTPDQLERATRGTIDVASHRLDAWITAQATRRLRELRELRPKGLHLGAYAWLTAPPVPAAPVVDGAVEDRGSRGHVLAPSLDHARAAAVLRAAFDARPTSELAVDLSSQRVAQSRWLFDGLRAGRGLAELLGYEIERTLVDAALVRTLRERFPLTDGGDPDPNRARLDGLAAYHAWRQAPPAGALAGAARALAELVDGASDLLLAEAVYQRARGNPERAGATLESVAAGTIAPPPCAVVETPVAGDHRRYQVVWAFAEAAPTRPGGVSRVRAVANPTLDAALAALIAPPAELIATITHGAGGVSVTESRSVLDLELCALDLCALVADDFAGSSLEAMFAATAPAELAPSVQPSPALAEAVVIARGFREALAQAVPWTSAETPIDPIEPTWASDVAAATAVIAQAIASADGLATRRLVAWLGAPGADAAAVRALATTRLASLGAAPDVQLRALSGLPPTRPLATALAPATELTRPAERVAWLADAARVRAPLAGLELVTAMATVPVAAGADAQGGAVLIVGKAASVSRALRLDAWTEVQPRAAIDAALALHHDAPRARAPQAILLAVPPVPGAAWAPASVLDVVLETFELVTARAARPGDVWGPTLPALYLSERLDDTTVSTRMAEVAVTVEVRG